MIPRRHATATASVNDSAPSLENSADKCCWTSRSGTPSVVASSAGDLPSDNDCSADRSQGVM
jgi:hypothetical protein